MLNDGTKIEDFLKFMSKREFEYSIHISKRNSYIYFEVPKVASSTTKLKLQQIEAKTAGLPPISEEMSSIHNKKQSLLLSPSEIGFNKFFQMLDDVSVFKFTFVRNPYTRILSAFLSKIQGANSPHRKKITQILDIGICSNPTFKQFLSAVSIQSKYNMDSHWRPQTDQLFNGLITFNFVGKFEKFEQDLNQVIQKILSDNSNKNTLINKDIYSIKFKGRKTNSKQKIIEFYDSDCQHIVKNIYKSDFENFGYSEKLFD